MSSKSGVIESIQVLRGLAAIGVVALHSMLHVYAPMRPNGVGLPFPFDNPLRIGAFGVDLFFIISGFIMIYIAKPYLDGRRSCSDFLIQRIIRIWPLYVVVTLASIAHLVYGHFKVGMDFYDLEAHRFLGLFFIPTFNEKGGLFPILAQGWTLNYEFLFYLCFSVALIICRRRNINCVPIVLLLIFSAIFFIGLVLPDGNAWSIFFANDHIFEFIFGSFIGLFYLHGKLDVLPWKAVLLAGVLATVVVSPFWVGLPRSIVAGIPMSLIFIGLLVGDPHLKWNKVFLLLGNASYSIYLTHTLVIYRVTDPFMTVAGIESPVTTILLSLAAIACASVLGIGVHFLVEKPMINILRQLFAKVASRKSLMSAKG